MSIRDEDLIQYLLGEADAVLVRRIQSAFQSDSHLAGRLDELRFALGLLDSIKGAFELPPADLTARTLDFIADQSQAKVQLRPTDLSDMGRRNGRRVWESLFAVASLAAVACLMLPLVIDARSVSRQLQCSYNLKSLGEGLTHLAMLSPDRRFPEVPLNRPDGFAGRFVLQLNDHGLLESPALVQRLCVPGSEPNTYETICIPNTETFLSYSPSQQAALRDKLGGNFAYIFGMKEGGRVVGPHLEGSSHLAILADAPQIDGDQDIFRAHEGRGFNSYFGDGHVAFLSLKGCRVRNPEGGGYQSVVPINQWRSAIDYPFRNVAGRQAYGLNLQDASLGSSGSMPQP